MESERPTPAPIALLGLSPRELDDAVVGWGWPRFRAKQLRDWVYQKLVGDPLRMTNFARRDQEMVRERVTFPDSVISANQLSNDGTRKLLLTWPGGGGDVAECVMIPDGDRRTACISSQVGCPVGCKF